MAACAAIVFFMVAVNDTAAQSGCVVGATVDLEMASGPGKITEIGTESPHVGWYRIVYDWNIRSGDTKGEWYNPKYRQIRVTGTDTICSLGGTRLDTSCPMNEPPGKVTKASAASAALFKRVIFERMAAKIGSGAVSAPKKIGLTFQEFQMGKAYKNTLTSSRLGDKRLHDGAPVGAMIYPIKTKFQKCELYDRSITRWLIQENFACFKDRFGDWVCPADSVPKFLEQYSIPVK